MVTKPKADAVTTEHRTTVWALEHTIDGHFTPEAYFGTFYIANEALSVIQAQMDRPANWRLVERTVWMGVEHYIEESNTWTSKWLKAHMDPEWSEYQRLEAKFKDAFK